MNANDSQDLKLKLAKEFKQLNSFIDRYAFYEQHKRELNYEDPQDPLMIEFNQCNEELRKFDEGKMPKSVEAVYRTDLEESTVINKRKFEIIELLKKQNEELGIYKPEPSSDEEGGQMIEYWVKQFEPSPSFEELKKNFEKDINGADAKRKIVEKELEKINKKLEGYNADMVSLLSRATANYKIKFSLLYKKAKEEKKSYYPLSFNYEKLASAIPLVQFGNFLENYPLNKVENTQHLNELVSTEPKEKTALSPSSDISTDVDKKEGSRTKDPETLTFINAHFGDVLKMMVERNGITFKTAKAFDLVCLLYAIQDEVNGTFDFPTCKKLALFFDTRIHKSEFSRKNPYSSSENKPTNNLFSQRVGFMAKQLKATAKEKSITYKEPVIK